MRAAAEGDVAARVAVDVEPVWVFEDFRVAVGQVAGNDDAVSGADEVSVELDVFERYPAAAHVPNPPSSFTRASRYRSAARICPANRPGAAARSSSRQ